MKEVMTIAGTTFTFLTGADADEAADRMKHATRMRRGAECDCKVCEPEKRPT